MSTVVRPVSVWELEPRLSEYLGMVRLLVREGIEKRLGGMVDIRELYVNARDVGNGFAEEIVEVALDVTGLLNLNRECVWFEGLYYSCQDGISQNIDNYRVCDPESSEYDEEKCSREIEECVNYHVEDFKNENCGLPFRFVWNNETTSLAYLRPYEDEDSYKLCCGVELYYRYKQRFSLEVTRDLLSNQETMERIARYTADKIIAEILRLVEALRALAQ